MLKRKPGKARIVEVEARTALVHSRIRGLDYALNPYTGCSHACTYCYARLYAPPPLQAEEWGGMVFVKRNIVELVAREAPRKRKGVVGVGTGTDPYQPVEAVYKLTRRSIEVLLANGYRVEVQTKNPLVLRDIDVFTQSPRRVAVGVTITTLDHRVSKRLEPNAPHPAARARAVEGLAAAGLEAWIAFAPIVPGFNDDEETVRAVAELAASTGASLYYDRLRVKPFMLEPSHPLYGAAIAAKKYPWRKLYRLIELHCRKLGARCIPPHGSEGEARRITDYLYPSGAVSTWAER